MNLVLSLKHSKPEEDFLTFWRPFSEGYTFYLDQAGQYNTALSDHYDNENNMPIDQELLYRLDKKQVFEFGTPVTAVLNNERNREILKIYYEKRTLKRR